MALRSTPCGSEQTNASGKPLAKSAKLYKLCWKVGVCSAGVKSSFQSIVVVTCLFWSAKTNKDTLKMTPPEALLHFPREKLSCENPIYYYPKNPFLCLSSSPRLPRLPRLVCLFVCLFFWGSKTQRGVQRISSPWVVTHRRAGHLRMLQRTCRERGGEGGTGGRVEATGRCPWIWKWRYVPGTRDHEIN